MMCRLPLGVGRSLLGAGHRQFGRRGSRAQFSQRLGDLSRSLVPKAGTGRRRFSVAVSGAGRLLRLP